MERAYSSSRKCHHLDSYRLFFAPWIRRAAWGMKYRRTGHHMSWGDAHLVEVVYHGALPKVVTAYTIYVRAIYIIGYFSRPGTQQIKGP